MQLPRGSLFGVFDEFGRPSVRVCGSGEQAGHLGTARDTSLRRGLLPLASIRVPRPGKHAVKAHQSVASVYLT
jgi:hypothetical protein